MRRVRIAQASDYDLVGELLDDGAGARREAKPARVSLKVLPSREHAG